MADLRGRGRFHRDLFLRCEINNVCSTDVDHALFQSKKFFWPL